MMKTINRPGITPYLLDRCLIAPVLALLILVLLTAGTNAQTTGLRVNITHIDSRAFPQITFYATVTAENGLPVHGLTAADFDIYEDGVRVPTTAISVENVMIRGRYLVLAIDLSTYADILPQLQAAAKTFVRQLGPEDRVSIVAFYDDIEVLTDFTNNSQTLEAAIDSLSLRGNYTTLNQLVFEAAKLVEDFPAGQKALIVLPDCKNNIGAGLPDAAIAQVQAAETPLYLIGVKTEKIKLDDLAAYAAETTGQVMLVEAGEVETILQQLAGQLPQGYRITYTSGIAADNHEHHLQATVLYKKQTGQGEGTFVAVANPVAITPNLTDGQTVSGLITLSAQVKSVAPPVMVSYWVDNEFLGQSATPPYAIDWESSTGATGSHVITVRAMDSGQNQGETRLTINVIPPVKVTVSTPQTEIARGDEIVIQAQIEAIHPLARVELLVDDQIIASRSAPPYGFAFDSKTYPEGTYTISVQAVDNQGYIGDDSVRMEFLPTWPERLRRWLGFEDRAEFAAWLAGARWWAITLGTFFIVLLLILLALLFLNRLLNAQRKYSRQTWRLAVLNQGNVTAAYQLWAKDRQDALDFGFFLNGVDLHEKTQVVMETLPPPPAETRPIAAASAQPAPEAPEEAALEAPEEAAPSSAETAPPPQTKGSQTGSVASAKGQLKQANEKTRKVMGVAGVIGSMLTGIAKILPRSIGRPLQNAANQIRMGQSRVTRTIRVPRQIAGTTSRVKSQAASLAPARTTTASSGASAPETRPTATAAFQEPTPTTVPATMAGQTVATTKVAVTRVPAGPGQPAAPVINGKEPATKTITVKLDRAETPEIEPGQALTVDLLIIPADPYKARTYDFELFSKPVDQSDETAVISPGTARIEPLAWFWRILPVFLIVLLDAFFIAAIILTALWLLNGDVWSYITLVGCNIRHLGGGIC